MDLAQLRCVIRHCRISDSSERNSLRVGRISRSCGKGCASKVSAAQANGSVAMLHPPLARSCTSSINGGEGECAPASTRDSAVRRMSGERVRARYFGRSIAASTLIEAHQPRHLAERRTGAAVLRLWFAACSGQQCPPNTLDRFQRVHMLNSPVRALRSTRSHHSRRGALVAIDWRRASTKRHGLASAGG